MELYVAARASPSNDIMNSNPTKISNHHDGTSNSSSSLRELDELLMGGNDLDAIPFEFGCDYFGSIFEDKYVAPANQVASSSTSSLTPSIVATITDSGIDTLPSLSASLLSPSMNFHLNMPSPSFPAHNEQQDRTKSIRSKSMNGHNFFHHRPLKRTCDSAFPSQSSQVESREKSAKDKTQSVTGNTLPASSAAASTHIGRWTKKEHELFIEGLKLYGKSWKKISSLVITRTLVQIRTHAQKYLQKQSKNAQKAAAAAAASGSSSSASTNSSKARQQQRCGAQKQNGKHLDAWKGQRGLVPISFPDILLASSSSSSSSFTYTPSSSPSAYSRSSSPYILPVIVKKESSNFGNNVCRLDQLLQDEPHGNAMEGYYQSSIGSDDEILHPMYVGAGHWSRDETHSAVVVPSCSSMPSASLPSSDSQQFPNKCRRLDHLMPASSSKQLINPMEAMTSSSEAQIGMFCLDVLHHGIGTADFHHQPSHHSYNPTTQFVDSEYIYSNWQLP